MFYPSHRRVDKGLELLHPVQDSLELHLGFVVLIDKWLAPLSSQTRGRDASPTPCLLSNQFFAESTLELPTDSAEEP